MKTYESLYLFAGSLGELWRHAGSTDLDKAAQLVAELKSVDQTLLSQMPKVANIIEYAETHSQWANDIVYQWPNIVVDTLEGLDKQYAYRLDGDNWEVYSLSYTGEEEWKATVETETLATNIVAMLTSNTSHSNFLDH
ncbi:hypothetical protein [Shewanella marisflavi]|uniref:hypothetical protein n=1 Tax=Shewanella marisflavi TaxID=260364 RepID=UPI003AAEBDF7